LLSFLTIFKKIYILNKKYLHERSIIDLEYAQKLENLSKKFSSTTTTANSNNNQRNKNNKFSYSNTCEIDFSVDESTTANIVDFVDSSNNNNNNSSSSNNNNNNDNFTNNNSNNDDNNVNGDETKYFLSTSNEVNNSIAKNMKNFSNKVQDTFVFDIELLNDEMQKILKNARNSFTKNRFFRCLFLKLLLSFIVIFSFTILL
jgi:hypothetical protein